MYVVQSHLVSGKQIRRGYDVPLDLSFLLVESRVCSRVLFQEATMIDLTGIPFIDHHCHPLDPGMAILTGEELASVFMHGLGDVDTPLLKGKSQGASAELCHHITNFGVVQTMVCQLSRLLECPAELEAVASERNRRTSESFAGYVKLLYEDAGIVATVVDAGLPTGDPLLDLFPGPGFILFQPILPLLPYFPLILQPDPLLRLYDRIRLPLHPEKTGI